jgi:hypothetical protein
MFKLLFTFAAAASAAGNPGLGGSVSQDGLNEAKNVLTPFIFKNLVDLKIAKVDISGGSFTNIVANIP